MKVAFLDRDGTIVRDYPDEEWRTFKPPVFLPGARKAMYRIKKAGYELIILTNQYIIGEGIITREQYDRFTKLFTHALAECEALPLDIFFCPHRRSDGCACCKPRTGMIRQALDKYPDIDLSQSFYVGDTENDRLLAQAAGLRFFGIDLQVPNRVSGLSDVPEALGIPFRPSNHAR